MLVLIAIVLIILTAIVAVSDAAEPDSEPRKPAPARAADDAEDGFAARPFFAEPPDAAIVGFGAPHLRPDPERLIQTEVLVREPRLARLAATIRLALTVFFMGTVVGFVLIGVGMGIGRVLRRYAGA